MREYFDVATQRERRNRIPGLAASIFHSRPGDSRKTHARDALANCADQRRAKRIARRFAGNNADRDRGAALAHP